MIFPEEKNRTEAFRTRAGALVLLYRMHGKHPSGCVLPVSVISYCIP